MSEKIMNAHRKPEACSSLEPRRTSFSRANGLVADAPSPFASRGISPRRLRGMRLSA